MRFIDLFCGIGGFRSALDKEGFKCVFSCDIDADAAASYRANFGECAICDIKTLPAEAVPPHDLICAGFPCQSFSLAGRGKTFGDPRGQLFRHIVRIAGHHRPRALILENVPGILFHKADGAIKTIIDAFRAIGYDVDYNVLDASKYGIPQARRRVYFVITRKDLSIAAVFPHPLPGKPPKVRDYLLHPSELNGDNGKLFIKGRRFIAVVPSKDDTKPVKVGYIEDDWQGRRVYSIDAPGTTILANNHTLDRNGGLYMVDGAVRRLHITEAKRLMGFDDGHIVSKGNKGFKELGNAVIPAMVTHVFRSMRNMQ